MPKAEAIKDSNNQHAGYIIYCPACKGYHHLDTRWTFNGNLDRPTFQPSLLVNGRANFENPAVPRCHSFITDGRIQFLSDCTHEMAGKTVELPEVE
jgi:hypothetical protein